MGTGKKMTPAQSLRNRTGKPEIPDPPTNKGRKLREWYVNLGYNPPEIERGPGGRRFFMAWHNQVKDEVGYVDQGNRAQRAKKLHDEYVAQGYNPPPVEIGNKKMRQQFMAWHRELQNAKDEPQPQREPEEVQPREPIIVRTWYSDGFQYERIHDPLGDHVLRKPIVVDMNRIREIVESVQQMQIQGTRQDEQPMDDIARENEEIYGADAGNGTSMNQIASTEDFMLLDDNDEEAQWWGEDEKLEPRTTKHNGRGSRKFN